MTISSKAFYLYEKKNKKTKINDLTVHETLDRKLSLQKSNNNPFSANSTKINDSLKTKRITIETKVR